ncbi:hypothetical protein CI238_02396 [Colletotrichum incanum]|uniref:Uncharacterized protein n=1 Tax=Colletotrichum incanum TaxID=1573173 RepID=A0A167A9L8_COLIC|nr:hypothetical protein CI238_02396 [Colletotrichum incanum]OHX01035.1 hypothetical protein CSPAE12_00082 [Colletotrichum incanum]
MTRRLPWDRDALERLPTPKKPATATTPRKATVTKRATPKADGTLAPLESSSRKITRPNDFLGDRSPSTSPPPEPLPETFMIEGLDNDDKYRMVEDELFTIAGQFTAHLHAAQYQRLKAQARSQNAETIKNISRPVVGSLTDLARKRQEELLRKKKQREALRQAKQEAGRDGDESGDETSIPWRGTSLQGLMHSPRKKEVPLMALTRADSGMRSSSLFGGVVKSRSKKPAAAMKRDENNDEETEDESEDLGGPSRLPARGDAVGSRPSTGRPAHFPRYIAEALSQSVPQQRRILNTGTRTAETKPATHRGGPPTAMATRPASSTTATKMPPALDDREDDEEDDDIFTRFKKRRATSRPQRRGSGKKEEKPEPKESRDIIPSFI